MDYRDHPTAALWAPAFVDKLRREHGIAAVKGYLVLLLYVGWCKGEACDVSTLKDDDAAGCCELCVCVTVLAEL